MTRASRLVLTLMASLLSSGVGTATPDMPPGVLTRVKVTEVAALTGPNAAPPTRKADICGTDLGIPATLNGTLYLAFGDTFGYDGDTCTPFGPHWRSNVLGFTRDTTLGDGLSWDGWHTAPGGGAATAVVEGAHDAPFTGEQTKIPTAMLGLGSSLVLHYMSITGFAAQGGVWSCQYSQFLVSADGGWTWRPQGAHVGDASSHFNMLALSADRGRDNADGASVYVMGTACGRFGDAQLARVRPADLTQVARWTYYAGQAADGTPLWSASPGQAREVVPGPVGEASLSWNPYLSRWTYTFLNEGTASLELREAVHPWGPWSAPHVLATAQQYPQLYGAFSSQALQRNNGQTVYFVMSRFGPYNTYLMRAELSK